jgi:hypothetical protein
MLSVIRPLNLTYKIFAFLLFFSTFYTYSIAKTSADFNPKGQQVSYYKSPTSPYPSGETTIERLTQNLVTKYQVTDSYYLYKNQKISKQLLKTTTALDLSNSTSQRDNLRDLGFFLTLKKTALKTKAESKSKTIQILQEQKKLTALGYKNGFLLTEVNRVRGYVDISDCISKFDFAKAVYAENSKTKTKQWFYVKNRTFDQIETVTNETLYLNQIEGLFPDLNKAIITRNDQSLPLWTSLELKTDTNMQTWLQSKINGHGIVYWQKKSETSVNENKKIKIDDLLKKEISFVSFNPKNPRQAIASANGLYITMDGENWREIEQFKNYTGPVLFYNEFLIFAGNYKSTDRGQTFENYIQIEKLSAAISDKIGFDPKRLQVKKIKTVIPFKVEVDLDIGSRVIKVQTPVYTQDWRVVKI